MTIQKKFSVHTKIRLIYLFLKYFDIIRLLLDRLYIPDTLFVLSFWFFIVVCT